MHLNADHWLISYKEFGKRMPDSIREVPIANKNETEEQNFEEKKM
jgi:hypothetical protein